MNSIPVPFPDELDADLFDCSRHDKPAGTRAFGPGDSWRAWTGLSLLVHSEEEKTGDIKPGLAASSQDNPNQGANAANHDLCTSNQTSSGIHGHPKALTMTKYRSHGIKTHFL